VNHVYLVWCVIDILSLSLIYCDCIVVLDLIVDVQNRSKMISDI
jgi:hypothetical protein